MKLGLTPSNMDPFEHVAYPRRHTSATNGDLVEILGVSRAGSVPNLTRRFERWLSTDRRVRKELERLEHKLSQEQGE